jgi:hypothetical protein
MGRYEKKLGNGETCRHGLCSVENETPLCEKRPCNFRGALFGLLSSNSRFTEYAAGPGLTMRTSVASRVLLPAVSSCVYV